MSPSGTTLTTLQNFRASAAAIVTLCDTALYGSPWDAEQALVKLWPAMLQLNRAEMKVACAMDEEDAS